MSKIEVYLGDGSVEMQDYVEPEYKQTKTPSEVELLKAQLKAQTDHCDFLEDCIAEMAMQVYN